MATYVADDFEAIARSLKELRKEPAPAPTPDAQPAVPSDEELMDYCGYMG